MGEMLVEIMRPRVDMPLDSAAEFLGPYPSGAPAIFIDTVAKLGSPAGIIGGVGRDDFGKCLTERLGRDGVDCRFVSVVEGISSAVAFVTYFADGSRKFIYHIGNTPAAMSVAPDIAGIEDPAFFHLMGCSLLASEPFRLQILLTLDRFVARGAKISFDPNIRVELLSARTLDDIIAPVMRHCAILHPGVDELYMLAGVNDEAQAVEKLFRNPRLETIALKRGKKGCTVYTRERSFSLGVYEVEAVDPTGAGDSFDAGFLCGLMEGKTLEECATIATAAAALNTAAFGPMEGNINAASMRAIMKGHLA